MLGQKLVQPFADDKDLLGVDVDIRRLTLGAAAGLVNHGARVGEAETLAFRAARQQKRPHAGRLADTGGVHIGFDELHGVVHRQACCHRAAGAVDVEVDVLVGVLRFEEQKLRHDQVRHVVLDRTHGEYQALLEQPGEDIVGALAAGGLLNHHRHQPEVLDHILVAAFELVCHTFWLSCACARASW